MNTELTAMVSRVIPRKDVQAMIKALRVAGLTVIKGTRGMYTCGKDDKELFAACPGRNGYLVRMRKDLFVTQ